jgi:hypothetical protein
MVEEPDMLRELRESPISLLAFRDLLFLSLYKESGISLIGVGVTEATLNQLELMSFGAGVSLFISWKLMPKELRHTFDTCGFLV